MGRLELCFSLMKCFLYISLAFVLLADMNNNQPLSSTVRIIIVLLAILEVIILIRKIDNRKQKNS